MSLRVAVRTNISLVTWQEDLAAPQPTEEPEAAGEGAPEASTGDGGEVRLCHGCGLPVVPGLSRPHLGLFWLTGSSQVNPLRFLWL